MTLTIDIIEVKHIYVNTNHRIKMNEQLTWKILDKYFIDNPTALVNHHLESYNDFFNGGINQIFREKNPIKIVKLQNPDTKNYKLKETRYLLAVELVLGCAF